MQFEFLANGLGVERGREIVVAIIKGVIVELQSSDGAFRGLDGRTRHGGESREMYDDCVASSDIRRHDRDLVTSPSAL
jgi:hypothetical protein